MRYKYRKSPFSRSGMEVETFNAGLMVSLILRDKVARIERQGSKRVCDV